MKITKEWLEEYYVRQGLSQRECVELSGTSKGSIYDALKKYGIKAHASGGQRKETTFIDGIEHKVCTRCEKLLPLDCFIKLKSKNYTSDCKECRALIKAEARRLIKPDMKDYISKDDFKTNLINIWTNNKQTALFWCLFIELFQNEINNFIEDEKNKNKKKYKSSFENQQKYYLHKKQNPEQLKKVWRKARNARRARLRNLPSTLTLNQWQETLRYFNYSCCYCGSTNDLVKDHIIPVIEGGGFVMDNIVPACAHCNNTKHAMSLCDWYPKQPFFSNDRFTKILNWQCDTSGKSRLARWK